MGFVERPVTIALHAAILALVATVSTAQPSFDCAKATSTAEEMICADAALGQLDRRLANRFSAAMDAARGLEAGSEDAIATLRAYQRGWIKGRDDCWKADDRRACITQAYLRREVELVTRWMLDEPSRVVAFICDGNPANEVTAIFFDTELPGVRLEYGDSIASGASSRTASGSRYDADFGRFIWIKGNEAVFSWDGENDLTCTAR